MVEENEGTGLLVVYWLHPPITSQLAQRRGDARAARAQSPLSFQRVRPHSKSNRHTFHYCLVIRYIYLICRTRHEFHAKFPEKMLQETRAINFIDKNVYGFWNRRN